MYLCNANIEEKKKKTAKFVIINSMVYIMLYYAVN